MGEEKEEKYHRVSPEAPLEVPNEAFRLKKGRKGHLTRVAGAGEGQRSSSGSGQAVTGTGMGWHCRFCHTRPGKGARGRRKRQSSVGEDGAPSSDVSQWVEKVTERRFGAITPRGNVISPFSPLPVLIPGVTAASWGTQADCDADGLSDVVRGRGWGCERLAVNRNCCGIY